MISDNYVTGDNIYLRELQNFFFEVLGMMSITHYGAIGDGRRDNYGPIQVAIDDANRRGLSFLYVPYGKFIYTGEFTNLIDETTGKQKIIFVGNPHAHIVNIRTGQEIEIHQFGWCSCNGDGFFTTIDKDIELHQDGTTTPELESGKYYFLAPGRVVKYYSYGGEVVTTTRFDNSILFYKNDGVVNYLARKIADNEIDEGFYGLDYFNEGYWDVNKAGRVVSWDVDLRYVFDKITPSSDDVDVPSIGAVKDYINGGKYEEGSKLTSRGTAAINTKFKPRAGTKIEMKAEFVDDGNTAQQSLFGQHYGHNMSFGWKGSAGTNKWFMVTNLQVDEADTGPSYDTPYVIEFYMGTSEQYLKIDGVTEISASRSIPSGDGGESEAFLFTRNGATSSSDRPFHNYSNARIYYAKIYQDDELVRDFVPARRERDGEHGMYDKVTKQFFENIGIGAFNWKALE